MDVAGLASWPPRRIRRRRAVACDCRSQLKYARPSCCCYSKGDLCFWIRRCYSTDCRSRRAAGALIADVTNRCTSSSVGISTRGCAGRDALWDGQRWRCWNRHCANVTTEQPSIDVVVLVVEIDVEPVPTAIAVDAQPTPVAPPRASGAAGQSTALRRGLPEQSRAGLIRDLAADWRARHGDAARARARQRREGSGAKRLVVAAIDAVRRRDCRAVDARSDRVRAHTEL